MRVAVVGAGVSGLAAAHELAGKVSLTVYEKEESLGGHARAVDVDGVLVDPDLMLFNSVTHPNMVRWFEELGVEMEPADTTLSVSTELTAGGRCEWGWDSSRNAVSGLLARKSNALSPSFWRMIREVLRFQDDALAYLHKQESDPDLDRDVTLDQFVNSHGYSRLFQEAYLIPICACIWPCPTHTGVTGFSAFSVLSFCRNHHLLQIFGRPQWLTVKGRPRSYVNKVREELESKGCRIKTSCRVKSVSSFEGGHRVVEADGPEEVYDKIIFGGHAPDVLRVLGEEATHEELRILGAFQYVESDIYLHCDESLMPRNPSAWSACNFLGTSTGVTVTYWLNLLQNIESGTGKKPNFLVTPNPPRALEHVLLKWNTSHPVPSVAAAKASRELRRIHSVRGIWFCGAYQGWGYGFHEDGLRAGKSAAQALLRSTGKGLLLNPKQMVPSWVEAGARLLVTRFLNRYVILGSMILHEQGGTVFSFGQVSRKCHVKSVLRIHDPLFYCKVATEADLGLAMADAYIDGYLSFVDKREGLLNLLMILIANREAHKASSTAASKRAGIASAKYFMRHVSTRPKVFRPYDLGNEFFSLFLDPSMTFSCAIFKAEDESLQVAQQRKVSLLIEKARVERDHHVLEIGNGWGNLALQLVKQTGCKYTGVNLSKEELKYTQMKVKEAGLEDHIHNIRCGYRKIPTDCKYDRIIACEMIEGVGPEYLDDFFGCCESLLAPEGLLVLQSIAIPEQRCDEYRRSSDFVKEYIFPGECLHSLTRVMSAMSAASTLCVEHIENIGYHYYLTQMRWRDNFMAKEEKISALGYDDKFIRTWEYYFAYTAADFKSRMLGNYQIVCSRPGNNKLALADNPYASFPAA